MALKHEHHEQRRTDTKHMDIKGCCPGVSRAHQAGFDPRLLSTRPCDSLCGNHSATNKNPRASDTANAPAEQSNFEQDLC